MKEIIIKIPDEFTDEQVMELKYIIFDSIANTLRRELRVPKDDIDAVELKVSQIKAVMFTDKQQMGE